MVIEPLAEELAVCKVEDYSRVDLEAPFVFTGRTDGERSLVCPSPDVPPNATDIDGGWRAMRVRGPLDFSLTGILAKIAGALAERDIPLFAISTFDTDYVLVKREHFDGACAALEAAGYDIA